MADPVILWRESFGYGSLTMSQRYVTIGRTPPFVAAGTPGDLFQWGRGSGADEGFAMRGGAMAVRATSLGFGSAINTASQKIGFACAYNQAGNLGGSTIVAFWDDDGHGNGTFDMPLLHLAIEVTADGRICATNGSGSEAAGVTTIIAISSYVLPVGLNAAGGNFTHIEVVPPASGQLIDAVNGGVKVYADGTLILDLTGKTTRNMDFGGGSGKVGYVQFHANNGQNGGARLITDVILHDCSGDGRIGDQRVSYQPAITLGTYTDGTPVGATPILNCIDEQAANGDTDYIDFDDTSLPKAASFVCKAMPTNCIAVKEVTPLVTLRKSDASTNTTRQVFISGATEVDNGSDVATPSGYNVFTGTGPEPGYQTDPNTSAAWTIPNCDASEVGSRRIA